MDFLRSPEAIRARAGALFERALAGQSEHFSVDLAALDHAAAAVVAELASATAGRPHGRLRHLDAGGVPRAAALYGELAGMSPRERARALIDLVVPSVLLDAGAGPRWSFRDGEHTLARSEGLAVASLRMFERGLLGSAPRTCEAAQLLRISREELAGALQVTEQNELVGLSGRLSLLRALGRALSAHGHDPRPAFLFDRACDLARGAALPAATLLALVLEELEPVFPARTELQGHNLGDVFPHPALGGGADGLVPFHKLGQWLTYSLVEPLALGGVSVADLDQLTGLAEYRNGGLFWDTGVVRPRSAAVTEVSHDVASSLVVEWRALTVALLDRLRAHVRAAVDRPVDAAEIEAASWLAGRKLARLRRGDASAPLSIASDATVF